MYHLTIDKTQPGNKQSVKRGMPLQLTFLLDVNSAECKAFENLLIYVKNFLT